MGELRRNGSGYYDPTAYKALKNIEREEQEMEIRKGEVWQVEIGNSVRTVVVLAVHGSYSTVLTFSDEQRERRTVQLNAQGMKYTEPGMVSYKFHDAFDKFIRLTTDEEFADIIKQVSEALGLDIYETVPFAIGESKEIQRLQVALEDASAKIIELEKDNVQLAATIYENEKTDSNITVLKTERDLYKSQFESLLERVIAKAV